MRAGSKEARRAPWRRFLYGTTSVAVPDLTLVIPGWSEGPDPESRDSGFALCAPRNDVEVVRMILPALFFYLFAAVLVASAVMVIVSRNPVHSVLYLILAFVNASGLFVLMGAE